MRRGSGEALPDAAGFALIEDAESWSKLVARVDAGRVPAAGLPAPDFERELLVFVSLGMTPSAGYSVTVEKVSRDGDLARVRISMARPKPGMMQAAVVQHPFVAVAIPRDGIAAVELIESDREELGRIEVGERGMRGLPKLR